MRKFVFAALATLVFAAFGASQAIAAKWTCQGPYVACGGSSAKKASKSYKAKSYKKKYTSKKKHKGKTYRKKYTSKKKYRSKSYSKKYASKKKYRAKKKYSSKSRSYKKVASRKSRKNRRYSGGGLRGKASYYWQPQRVASGGWFNPNAMTAAHKTLPFGTRVRVTNLRNGRSVVVRINDRGPYIKGRIIDLSRAAAGVIGMRKAGVVPVRVQVLGRGKKKG